MVIDGELPAWREMVRRARALYPDLPVIMVSARGSEALAVEALREGINDYLKAPIEDAALEAAVARVVARPTARGEDADGRSLLGDTRLIADVRRQIRQLARSTCNVLIRGETGVGKELAARLIHDLSARRKGAFVSLNCAALPEALIESELFGYERGSFTGASTAYPGKMKLADGGTLFLDEVGEMSLMAQAKLLRALESRTVFRLGGHKPVPVDFRLLSATNQDLTQRTREGLFRLDLYYRLKVVQLDLPPLRDRLDDIPTLAAHALRTIADTEGRGPRELSPESLACLCRYDWPGNVRELHNVIAAAGVLAGGSRRIEADHLPSDVRRSATVRTAAPPPIDEAARVAHALAETLGNKSAAAKKLQWSRMTLYRKLAKYQLDEPHLSHK